MSILDLVQDELFVVDGYAAIPDSYAQSEEEKARKVSFTPSSNDDVIVFSGSTDELANENTLLAVSDNIKNLYTDTGLNNYKAVKTYTVEIPDTEAIV
jgi:hypothetical protein